MKRTKTHRGFPLITFQDLKGVECTIQKSSVATEDCIWLGAAEIGLKEFVRNRASGESWRDVVLENTREHTFVANNRMHLTQDQVRELIPILTKFVDTGELP